MLCFSYKSKWSPHDFSCSRRDSLHNKDNEKDSFYFFSADALHGDASFQVDSNFYSDFLLIATTISPQCHPIVNSKFLSWFDWVKLLRNKIRSSLIKVFREIICFMFLKSNLIKTIMINMWDLGRKNNSLMTNNENWGIKDVLNKKIID